MIAMHISRMHDAFLAHTYIVHAVKVAEVQEPQFTKQNVEQPSVKLPLKVQEDY